MTTQVITVPPVTGKADNFSSLHYTTTHTCLKALPRPDTKQQNDIRPKAGQIRNERITITHLIDYNNPHISSQSASTTG